MLDLPTQEQSSSQTPASAKPESTLEGEPVPGRGVYTEEARLARLDFLRETTGSALSNFQDTRLSAPLLRGNVENFIGSVEVPLGIAGPLSVDRSDGQHVLYAPIATTEGALVASITRGAKAATLSGGIRARAIRQRMTRAPLFECSDIDQALRLADFIRARFDEIREQVRAYSNFADLREIDPILIGKSLHLRFSYETADAAGQNMTTICTWNACRWLLDRVRSEGLGVEEFFLEGNLSTDKKVSQASISSGRGTRVIAECVFKREALRQILKTTPEDLLRHYHRAQSGAFHSGMMGSNINVSNVVAGIFTATGQDIACVHESSVGQLHLEPKGQDLYASLTLPSLIVGTVGGGVKLPQQAELVELLGCAGKGKSGALAETIAAFALALDLSTLAAIVSGHFASAHERLGRENHKSWLKRGELTHEFFASLCQHELGAGAAVSAVTPLREPAMGDSVLMDAASQVTQRFCGLLPFRLEARTGAGKQRELSVLLKLKPIDEEVILATETMTALCNDRLAEAFRRARPMSPFRNCHVRELEVWSIDDARLTSIAPRVYGTLRDDSRQIYLLAEELLTAMALMNTADDVSGWSPEALRAAIEGIAGFHSIDYGKAPASRPWIAYPHTAASMVEMSPFFLLLAEHAREEFFSWFTAQDFERHSALIESIPSWWGEIERLPRSLIHNDFNPRNIAFRKLPGELKLCAYDWELVTSHLPQRDTAELLCFTLSERSEASEVDGYIELHRRSLERASGVSIDPGLWRRGFLLALYDFMVYRLAMYFVAHTHRHCPFLERAYATTRHLIRLLEEKA